MKVEVSGELLGAAMRAWVDSDGDLRAALAAVIPAIQAEALERAAVVADEFPARTHGALATAPYAAAEQAADEIAAAIRALKEGT